MLDADDLIGSVRMPLASLRSSREGGGRREKPQVGREGCRWYQLLDGAGNKTGEIALDLLIGQALEAPSILTYVTCSDFVACKVISREEFDRSVLAQYPPEVASIIAREMINL